MNVMNRWQQKLYDFSLFAVLFTTLFSWFNVNSICIMLLILSRLIYRPLDSLKSAFSDKVFLTLLIFCLVDAAGFLHTNNYTDQGKIVVKEATLVAIGFALCSAPVSARSKFLGYLLGYYLMLVLACLFCLVQALREYLHTGDHSVFFYHSLTRPISQNAVFFSLFVVFGLLFLLSPGNAPARFSPVGWRWVRVLLATFFLGMIVLLNSKLMLVISLLIVIHSLVRGYSYKRHKGSVLILGAIIVAAVSVLAATDNPISARYRDMAGDLAIVKQKQFNPNIYFDALQLRLLEWRFAFEIIGEHHAWLIGVSPGDSQDLLDEKYVQTNMYIGNPAEGPHRHVRGFIGYNFHNQFLETFVRSGIIGLAALLAVFVAMFRAARRKGCREAWYTVLILAVFFIPEAPLTLQHGIFLFCFFPLLALNTP
jgi:O-antigen ligase